MKIVRENQKLLQENQSLILSEMSRISVKMDQIIKQQAQFSQGEAAPICDINLKDIGCPFASVEAIEAFEKNLLDVDFFKKIVSLIKDF